MLGSKLVCKGEYNYGKSFLMKKFKRMKVCFGTGLDTGCHVNGTSWVVESIRKTHLACQLRNESYKGRERTLDKK